jgi:hypothetical protein
MMKQGNVAIMGDMNARVSVKADFLDENGNEYLNLPTNYCVDKVRTVRNNMDKISNKYGNSLLNICKNLQLRILNGRCPGDLLGQTTCFQHNGASTVDLAIVNEKLVKDIAYFYVSPPSILSDHSPISIRINTKIVKNIVQQSTVRQPDDCGISGCAVRTGSTGNRPGPVVDHGWRA